MLTLINPNLNSNPTLTLRRVTKVRKWTWCQDTSDPGHFGPKTFRHHQTGAEVSGQFGTSAEVSFGHFGTSAELSRLQAHISRISELI